MAFIFNPFFSSNSTEITTGSFDYNNIYGYISVPLPNFCAFENKPSNFKIVGQSDYAEKLENNRYRFGVTFQCQGCYKYVAVGYISTNSTGEVINYDFNFSDKEIKFPFDENVGKNFPDFKNIYMQAQKAENQELNDLVGPGYRKALENLIKEYLIKFCDKKRESIEKRNLSDCASDLENETIIKVVKTTIWAGNDETHYDSNQNPELDINDLKNGINFTVNYLSSQITQKKFIKIYDKKKGSKKSPSQNH